MTVYEACITGIYPRNDKLIMTWKDFEWGRTDRESLADEMKRSTKEVIDLQIDAGLTYIHYPQLEWHDLFRPFTELEGLRAGPLTRFFETNTFFRRPILNDDVRYSPGLLEKYVDRSLLPQGKRLKVSLPGPYTFLRLMDYNDPRTALHSITNIIVGAMGELYDSGFSVIDLHEPAIAYHKDLDWDKIYMLYRPIIDSGYPFWIYLYFGGISGKVGGLLKISVDKISIDIYSVSHRELEFLLYKELILGIVDAQNTLMEDVDRVRGICISVSKKLELEKLIVSSNTHMEYLPYHIATHKLKLLGRLLRELS